MNTEILLEQFCRDKPLPETYRFINVERFGEQVNLFPYQQQALQSVMNCLYLYFKEGKERFLEHYKYTYGFNDVREKLPLIKDPKNDKESFSLLEKHFDIANDTLSFEQICNRASFWMATGSGKTLVMVKLIEILFHLSKLKPEEGGIPKNDILILAPKPKILEQIKDQVNIFNQKNDLQIDLRELKDWEQYKRSKPNLYEENRITVFYYNSFNIKHTGIDTANETLYSNYLHGTDDNGIKYGSWYVLLDEAHKGVTGDSIKQSIYTVLAKNGFLFNFSATFTDAIDKATTVFNFNLEKFINAGYGKHLKVTQQEFKNFNKKNQEEYSEEERKNIVLKSLIALAVVKKAKKEIDSIKKGMYHNPLMITIANTVNTVDADLKIFFQALAEIAGNREVDISRAKGELLAELRDEKFRAFEFRSGKVNDYVLNILGKITFNDIKKLVFNTTGTGSIEVIECEAKDELAFQLSTANGKPFALLKASEAIKWNSNILEGFVTSKDVVSKSFFDDLNSPDSSINILLGSRIFSEGWDSNRPNIVNFINIGVSEAQKFVLQSIGRGVRVEPLPNKRNRFDFLQEKEKLFTVDETQKLSSIVQAVETFYIFSTNKETIGAILQNITSGSEKEEWKKIEGIKKTDIKVELPVPEYEDLEVLNPNKFKIATTELNAVQSYVAEAGSRVLLAEHNIHFKTLKLLKDNSNFVDGALSNQSEASLLKAIDFHFFTKPKRIKSFRAVTDGASGDINHYLKIKTKLEHAEVKLLHELIEETIEKKYKTRDEIYRIALEQNWDYTQLQFEFEKFDQQKKAEENPRLPEVDRQFLMEHFYNPVLLVNPSYSDLFQNVISADSELDFYRRLISFAKNANGMSKYDWWYFSKVVENVDNIKIPYYNSEKGEYSNFYPDFIFWLKQGNKYIITFIDPKGLRQGTENTRDKVLGFENVFPSGQTFEFAGQPLEINLWLYNEQHTNDTLLNKYRRWNFDEMF
jgi:superfamily II DNA or RNA helicase